MGRPFDSSSQVEDRIAGVLYDPALEGSRLLERLLAIRRLERVAACAIALRLLARLELDEARAEALLGELVAHRDALARALGRDPGLAVAALDALAGAGGILRDPVVREAGRRDGSPGASWIDPRTGVCRRRAFEAALTTELRRAARHGYGFALARLDLDGPGSTDRTLGRAVRGLRRAVRESDTVGRVGAAEFALLLPRADRAGAFAAAERACSALRDGGADGGVRVAGGVACHPTDGTTARSLLDAAEAALAHARASGRESVSVHRAERRGSLRYAMRGAAGVVLARRDGGTAPGRLIDLGAGGALVETPLVAGAREALRIDWGGGREPDWIGAHVARVEHEPAGTVARLGIAFEAPLGDERLRALAARGRAHGARAGAGA